MLIQIRLLADDDAALLKSVASGVFDQDVQPELVAEFLTDPRHHVVVALEREQVVGFVTAVDYVHPDKPPELWINEVGVAARHQRLGIGKRMLRAMLSHGRRLGCKHVWVLTERSNSAALSLYRSAGGVEPAGDVVMFEFHLDGNAADDHAV